MGEPAAKYERRKPEETVLYDVLSKNLDAFRKELYAKGKALPGYVEEEFAAYFDCGRLENGFLRLKCSDCSHEKLLGFSCKRRGFCPSCCGRRMNEVEMKLIEEVFPKVHARQWVLSLPMPLRFLCARNRRLVNILVEIFYKAVSRTIESKLRDNGVPEAKTGGVLVIQRLGGSLNSNIHFHAIFLDGGYTFDEREQRPVFHDLGDTLTSEDVANTVQRIFARAFKALGKSGFLEDGNVPDGDVEVDGVTLIDGASVKGKIAFGPRAGQPVRRIRLPMDDTGPMIRGELVATMNWFNLKADKKVKGHQRWKLARLLRYIARPPLANDRLTLADDGTIRYSMKKPWSDGTIEIQLSGVELVEKIAAAVPPPNGHLTRYFGVLAPNSKIRKNIVLVPKPKARDETGRLKSSATQRVSWADLAKRTFEFDLTKCELCGGSVKCIAVIRSPAVISKILRHLGLASSPNAPYSVAGPRLVKELTYDPIPDS